MGRERRNRGRKPWAAWAVGALLMALGLGAWPQCGDTWQLVTSPVSSNLYGVCYGGGLFAAVGANGTILTSPDGSTWTSRTSPTTQDLSAVAYGNGRFVATVAAFGGPLGQYTVVHSSDGVTWQLAPLSPAVTFTRYWLDIAYGTAGGFSRFAATGYDLPDAGVCTSIDGVTWGSVTSFSFGGNTPAYCGTLGGNAYVGVGHAGLVFRSADLLTFNQQTSGVTHNLMGVAFGAGWFVAVGASGAAIRSQDGVTWTTHTSGVTVELEKVRYLGSRFFAVGFNGTILASAYGTNWTSISSGVSSVLYDAAYSGSAMVIVGLNGTILRSNCSSTPLSLTSVSPTAGPTAGGTSATLTGTGFASGATVTFGGNAATGVSVVSSTSITCTTPAHAAGQVNVTVTNPGGGGSATLTNGYTYSDLPSLASVTPNQGPTAGGTSVTIAGSSFQSGATVTFGGNPATSVTMVSSSSITCVTPAHGAGAVQVTVTNPGGASATLNNGFTYTDLPSLTVTACTPASGPEAGGTNVTLTGTGLQSGASVSFGGSPATGVNVASTTSITCTTPAHAAGPVNVTVTNPGGASASLPNGFTYGGGPGVVTVTACNPNSGPESGGTNVTITGTGFQSQTDVLFGGALASGVNVVSSTTLTCLTPPHLPGPVEIQVAVIGVGVAFLPNGFTYGGGPPGPTINSVAALGSPFRLRILGSNFHPGCVIRVNGNPVPTSSFKNSGKVVAKGGSALKAMVPAGVPVEITVLNTDDGGISAPFAYIR